MRYLILIPFILSLNLNSQSIESVTINDIKESNISVPMPKIKEWTVAIYMNGRSNIEPFAFKDFNRFETVGSNEEVNILVEIGRAKGFKDSNPDWQGVRRYYVKKDDNPDNINSDLIEDLGNIDMGNWKNAADFLKWVKENYPAKKIMFIIWDHGWGWIDPVKENQNLITKSISHDFVTGNYIKTTELPLIFKSAGGVDVYASMACFMQMAEVAYGIKDYANVIIGSEEVIQLPSFNWEDFFALLEKNPSASSDKVGIYMVDTFKEMYSRPQYYNDLIASKYGTQLSAIRGNRLDKFAQIIKKISAILSNYKDIEAISKAKKEVLRFEVGDENTDPDKLISFYGDIYNFCELVEKYSKDSEEKKKFAELTRELKNLIDRELVIKNVYLSKDRTGKDYSNTHGIAMHIPGKKGNLINYYPTYNELAFEKATLWSMSIKYLETIE